MDVGYFSHLGEGGEGTIKREGILEVRFVYKLERNATACGTATDRDVCGRLSFAIAWGGGCSKTQAIFQEGGKGSISWTEFLTKTYPLTNPDV